MRRVLTMLGIGVLAGVGLILVGFYIMPQLALWMMFAWIVW